MRTKSRARVVADRERGHRRPGVTIQLAEYGHSITMPIYDSRAYTNKAYFALKPELYFEKTKTSVGSTIGKGREALARMPLPNIHAPATTADQLPPELAKLVREARNGPEFNAAWAYIHSKGY